MLPVIFSFFKEHRPVVNLTAAIILAAAGLYSTVYEKNFYGTKYFGVFKELAEKIIAWNDNYGEQNISRNINVINSYYVDYYFNRFGSKPDYYFLRAENENYILKMKEQIERCNKKYFLYAWSNSFNPPEVSELIKRRFPKIIEQASYFNSEITLFGKDENFQREKMLESFTNFDIEQKEFVCDSTQLDSTLSYSGKFSLRINANIEYSCLYEISMVNLFHDSIKFANVSAWCSFLNGDDAHLVIEYVNESGIYEWQSVKTNNFSPIKNKWVEVFKTISKPKKYNTNDKVKMYIWNPGKNLFFIDDITINTFTDSK